MFIKYIFCTVMSVVYCESRYKLYEYSLPLNNYTFIIYNNSTNRICRSFRSIVITAIKCMIIYIHPILCAYRLPAQYISFNLPFRSLSICTIKTHYQATPLIITIQKLRLTYHPYYMCAKNSPHQKPRKPLSCKGFGHFRYGLPIIVR